MRSAHPRLHRLGAYFRSSKRNHFLISQDRPPPHPALHIPEIVGCILVYFVNAAEELYLPPLCQNPGGATTRQQQQRHLKRPDIIREFRTQWWYPLLVCKQWLEIGLLLWPRQVNWCDSISYYSINTIDTDLEDVQRLRLTFSPGSFSDAQQRESRWKAFQRALTQARRHGGVLPTTLASRCASHSTGLLPKVCELTMVDIPTTHHVTQVLSALARNLTLLDLKFANRISLDLCSLLSPTVADGGGNLTTASPLRCLYHLSLANVELSNVHPLWTLQCSLRLHTIRLKDIVAEYQSLRHLLFELCSPSLKALHLGILTSHVRARAVDPLYYICIFDLERLSNLASNLATLTLRCRKTATIPDVQRITLSFAHVRMIRLENPFLTITAIRDCVPAASSWGVTRTGETTGATIASTPSRFAIVRLDIDSDHVGFHKAETGLYSFLRTSAAAQLRELVAPHFLYADEFDMDQWTCKHSLVMLAARPERPSIKEKKGSLPTAVELFAVVKKALTERNKK